MVDGEFSLFFSLSRFLKGATREKDQLFVLWNSRLEEIKEEQLLVKS